ncbi:Zinc finger MYND-type [Trinorchestia longiramus]|nr:Zinc finger MYND-type [Trinorchestia longiramus]
MAFEAPQSSDEYPPAAFRAKYGMFLAPYGELLSPQEVLQNRMLGSAAKENLKKAFDITIGKLVRRRERCAECGEKPDKPVVCEGCHVAHYCNDRCRSARADTHALVCHELLQESYDQKKCCCSCCSEYWNQAAKFKIQRSRSLFEAICI